MPERVAGEGELRLRFDLRQTAQHGRGLTVVHDFRTIHERLALFVRARDVVVGTVACEAPPCRRHLGDPVVGIYEVVHAYAVLVVGVHYGLLPTEGRVHGIAVHVVRIHATTRKVVARRLRIAHELCVVVLRIGHRGRFALDFLRARLQPCAQPSPDQVCRGRRTRVAADPDLNVVA